LQELAKISLLGVNAKNLDIFWSNFGALKIWRLKLDIFI
jgi:hypothetical protein